MLAACATDNTPQGICARRVYDDPTVKDLMTLGAASPALLAANQGALKQAKRAATTRCLQDMGIVRPGGVEMEAPQR